MNGIEQTVIVTSMILAAIKMLALSLTVVVLLPVTGPNVPVLGVCCFVGISVVVVLLVNIGLLADIYKQSVLNQNQMAVVAVKRLKLDSRSVAAWKRRFFRS